MEHVVQFGISIDDDVIRKQVLDSAEKQIINDFKQIMINSIFERDYYSKDSRPGNPLSERAKDLVLEVLEEHKDDIIQRAAEMLADSLKRTKKVKQAVDAVLCE